MSEHDDIERRLREAFEARAHGAVDDVRPVPPAMNPDAAPQLIAANSAGPMPRASHRAPRRSHRRVYWLAPLSAAAAVALVVLLTTQLIGHGSTSGTEQAAGPSGTSTGSVATSAVSSAPAVQSSQSAAPLSGGTSAPAVAKTVRVTSDLGDGQVVGVGMPIVLNFSPAPTDASTFLKTTKVLVNGTPASGGWYWEKPYADQPLQAHYREKGYWPANSTVEVSMPIAGLSAGSGLTYSDALTSVKFTTGDSHVTHVDGKTHEMQTFVNGKLYKTTPVSLGAATTPTSTGTKVVMQKGENAPGTDTLRPDGTVMMSGPGYSNDPVQWSVRITASGEYLHAAPWNGEIGYRSTSNGCTNLRTAAGEWFYKFSLIGDVVTYVNTGGKKVSPLDGLGDWNVSWSQWMAGGQVPTS